MTSLDCNHKHILLFLHPSLGAPSHREIFKLKENSTEKHYYFRTLYIPKVNYYLLGRDVFWEYDSHESYTETMFGFLLINLNVMFRNQFLLTDNPDFLILRVRKNPAKQRISDKQFYQVMLRYLIFISWPVDTYQYQGIKNLAKDFFCNVNQIFHLSVV
jgi:hypothetical protein